MSQKLDITVLSGVSKGDIFHLELSEDKAIKIGRAADNDIVLQDASVSRNHARLELRGKSFFLVDCGSSGGTVLMGFHLTPGDNTGRPLTSGDEFKIGESIFRSTFEEEREILVPQPPPEKVTGGNSPARGLHRFVKWEKRHKLLVLGLVAILAVLLVLMPTTTEHLPKQRSNTVLSLPQDRVLGYVQAKVKNQRDDAHLDKVQFALPASDSFLEFDYRSEKPIELFIDQALLKRVEPTEGFWINGLLVIRDPLVGYERKLIFDNTGYPAKPGENGLLQWGIRNVRVNPISGAADKDPLALLENARALSDKLEVAPEGLFSLIRGLHRVLLRSLHELSQDAAFVAINPEATFPSVAEIQSTIDSLISERKQGLALEGQNRHLTALVELLGRLETELWRRIETRIRSARLSAKVKNFIEAHDLLMSGMAMIPDENDYRHKMTEVVFADSKVVPKSVKKKPERYRERAAAAAAKN